MYIYYKEKKAPLFEGCEGCWKITTVKLRTNLRGHYTDLQTQIVVVFSRL